MTDSTDYPTGTRLEGKVALISGAPQKHVALRRVGQPIELSNLIVFLASDESSFSTGAEFIADGGETAGLAPGAVT